MVECWLPYGETEVHVSVPLRELLGVVEPRIGGVIRDVEGAVKEASVRPHSCEPLEEMVGDASTVSIGVDGSLPVKAATQALSGLLALLKEKRGFGGVMVVVGSGLRRRGNQRLLGALRGVVPPGVSLREHTIYSEMVEELGKTTYGTAIEVSKPFLEGEVRIIIGEFHPDPLTGFKGPHSVILPQLSGFKTLEMGRRLYYQSLTGPGVIGGNPLLIDSQEAARLTGVDASLLLVTDHKGSVIDLLYGDVEAVWERALTEYHDLYTVEVEGADVYVVSPGGGRFDFDLYHSLWALRGVEKLRRGARIILVAECGEGLGAPALSKLAGVERLSELRRRHMLGGEALHFLRSTQRGVEILFVSALPRHLAEPLGLKAYPAANDALDAAGRGKVIILPYGLSIIPTRER